MKGLVSLLFILFISSTTFSQGKLKFETTTYDFGEVAEEEGPVTYSFNFVNVGDKPLQVLSVKASCGCTTPAWTKEEVAPGDSGFVKARYNPRNRPGSFRKSLRITFETVGGNNTRVLYIKGKVIPKPRSIEEKLAVKMGDLRVKYKSLNLGKITTEKPIEKSFDVYNSGDTTVVWMPEQSTPNHITVSFDPVELAPKATGKIIVRYDPEKKDDLGFITDNIKLNTSEKVESEKEFFVMATIEEYFPPMSDEELAEAPRLSFNKSQYDFGSVSEGTVLETEFELTNNGRDKLLIRKAKSNCSCSEVKISKSKIRPGKTVKMIVTFDTSGRKGRQYKTVTVFSNDPTAPSQMITLKAEVN